MQQKPSHPCISVLQVQDYKNDRYDEKSEDESELIQGEVESAVRRLNRKRKRASAAVEWWADGEEDDDDWYQARNHAGNAYGEIEYQYGTQYVALERDVFTKEQIDASERAKYRIRNVRLDEDIASSAESSLDEYSGNEFDCILDGYLNDPDTKRQEQGVKAQIPTPVFFPRDKTQSPAIAASQRMPYNSAAAFLPATNTLVAFGGRPYLHTDAGSSALSQWIFSLSQWQVSDCIPASPPPRFGHTLTTTSHDELYLHGGKNGSTVLDDTWRLTPVTEKEDRGAAPKFFVARRLKPFAQCAPALVFHTATVTDTVLQIFGGLQSDGLCSNQLWLFDTVTRTWLHPKLHGDAPPRRCLHSAAVCGSDLYIFGGADQNAHFASQDRKLSDLFVISLDQYFCREVATTSLGLGRRPSEPPLPRAGHSAHLCDGVLYILGGTVQHKPGTGSLKAADALELLEFRIADGLWTKRRFPLPGPLLKYHAACLLFGESPEVGLQAGPSGAAPSLWVVGGTEPCRLVHIPLVTSLCHQAAMHLLRNNVALPRGAPSKGPAGPKRKKPSRHKPCAGSDKAAAPSSWGAASGTGTEES
ncbi:tRNA wybutosine-synthesizing protein 2/3/4 [Diplonema papillatum]|nr:tRNA wybutosine-synthesizing protein 2/3/4 [Diplonema papillatum]